MKAGSIKPGEKPWDIANIVLWISDEPKPQIFIALEL
jgi:hypothetical protein